MKRWVGFDPLGWLEITLRMQRRVAEHLASTTAAAGPARALVVVTPWQGTGIPWFSLAVGLMLGVRGATVTFVVDDQQFGANRLRHAFILRCIRMVMPIVARRHRVLELSAFARLSELTDGAALARLAGWNATWALRGEMAAAGRAAFEARARRQLAQASGRIGAVLAATPVDMLFLPGGVYGTSGLWADAASRRGMRIASYDNAGYGMGMFAVDGLACHLDDIPPTFRVIRERCAVDAAERALVMTAATREIDQRRAGTDAFSSQIAASSETAVAADYAGGVLLALNSSWDSAALGRHHVFADSREWIVATVRHLLDHSAVPVIVRQHPAERLAFARTTDDYRGLLARHFGAHPRLHFIAAEDPVNSYALLAQVGSVVVHTSTIGTEATIYGRPVITSSVNYYADLGFVWRATDLAGYEALLDAAAAGQLTVSDAMRDDARLCYYATQICSWVKSVFNPEDAKRWSRIDLATLAADPPIARMLDALLTATPVALANHLARVSEGGVMTET